MQFKKNIAMLGSLPPLRGISSYCYELAKSLTERNCRVEFISFKSMYPVFLYPGKDLADDKTYPSVDLDDLAIKRNLTWYNPIGWILEGVKCKASLLHAQWWSLPLWPIYVCLCVLAKFRHMPVIFTVHNVLPHESSTLFRHLSKILFSLGDHFIVHTGLNRKQLTYYYGIETKKISLISHGPLDLHIDTHADKKLIRSEMGLSSDNKTVLLFGTIRSYKGIETAITAFSHVKKKIPQATLIIAGKPWQDWAFYDMLIKKYGLEKNVVTCLNYIPSNEVHRYFCAADLVILPYHHFDSQSGVGGTAVAFRKPLIVTNVGGLPDLVLDRRAIVPPANPTALAKAICDCLQDPALLKQMARDADWIAQKLSWSAIAKQTYELYEKIIDR